MNNDNHLDIITTNYSNASMGVLLGNGIGGFAAAARYSSSGPSESVAVADFNGDGYKDIATACLPFISVLMNNGASPGPAGTFGAPAQIPFPYFLTNALLAADVNDDGIQDIVLTDKALRLVSIFMGNLSGTFSQNRMVNFVQGSGAAYSALYDINNDYKLDLITVNPTAAPSPTVSVRPNISDLALNFVGNTMYISPPPTLDR
ncbi:VCBS repeat-containing protein [uncultured Thiodictyon sp.]|uniref:FG-GAP repeat domain-containing protein n=1 Tax=uncultured Thiodictyon sp. TaxID=1846217 RepID=UPI0025F355AD|nr:VCBS repeat-containing protein [uncultured Thiodictyon sp.]